MRSLMTRLVVERPHSNPLADWLCSELEQHGFDGSYTSRCIMNIVSRRADGVELRIGSCPTFSFCGSCERSECPARPASAAVGGKSRSSPSWASDEQRQKESVIDLLQQMVSSEEWELVQGAVQQLVTELFSRLHQQKTDTALSSVLPSTEPVTELEPVSPQDLADRYYAAFPPLSDKCDLLAACTSQSSSLAALDAVWAHVAQLQPRITAADKLSSVTAGEDEKSVAGTWRRGEVSTDGRRRRVRSERRHRQYHQRRKIPHAVKTPHCREVWGFPWMFPGQMGMFDLPQWSYWQMQPYCYTSMPLFPLISNELALLDSYKDRFADLSSSYWSKPSFVQETSSLSVETVSSLEQRAITETETTCSPQPASVPDINISNDSDVHNLGNVDDYALQLSSDVVPVTCCSLAEETNSVEVTQCSASLRESQVLAVAGHASDKTEQFTAALGNCSPEELCLSVAQGVSQPHLTLVSGPSDVVSAEKDEDDIDDDPLMGCRPLDAALWSVITSPRMSCIRRSEAAGVQLEDPADSVLSDWSDADSLIERTGCYDLDDSLGQLTLENMNMQLTSEHMNMNELDALSGDAGEMQSVDWSNGSAWNGFGISAAVQQNTASLDADLLKQIWAPVPAVLDSNSNSARFMTPTESWSWTQAEASTLAAQYAVEECSGDHVSEPTGWSEQCHCVSCIWRCHSLLNGQSLAAESVNSQLADCEGSQLHRLQRQRLLSGRSTSLSELQTAWSAGSGLGRKYSTAAETLGRCGTWHSQLYSLDSLEPSSEHRQLQCLAEPAAAAAAAAAADDDDDDVRCDVLQQAAVEMMQSSVDTAADIVCNVDESLTAECDGAAVRGDELDGTEAGLQQQLQVSSRDAVEDPIHQYYEQQMQKYYEFAGPTGNSCYWSVERQISELVDTLAAAADAETDDDDDDDIRQLIDAVTVALVCSQTSSVDDKGVNLPDVYDSTTWPGMAEFNFCSPEPCCPMLPSSVLTELLEENNSSIVDAAANVAFASSLHQCSDDCEEIVQLLPNLASVSDIIFSSDASSDFSSDLSTDLSDDDDGDGDSSVFTSPVNEEPDVCQVDDKQQFANTPGSLQVIGSSFDRLFHVELDGEFCSTVAQPCYLGLLVPAPVYTVDGSSLWFRDSHSISANVDALARLRRHADLAPDWSDTCQGVQDSTTQRSGRLVPSENTAFCDDIPQRVDVRMPLRHQAGDPVAHFSQLSDALISPWIYRQNADQLSVKVTPTAQFRPIGTPSTTDSELSDVSSSIAESIITEASLFDFASCHMTDILSTCYDPFDTYQCFIDRADDDGVAATESTALTFHPRFKVRYELEKAAQTGELSPDSVAMDTDIRLGALVKEVLRQLSNEFPDVVSTLDDISEAEEDESVSSASDDDVDDASMAMSRRLSVIWNDAANATSSLADTETVTVPSCHRAEIWTDSVMLQTDVSVGSVVPVNVTHSSQLSDIWSDTTTQLADSAYVSDTADFMTAELTDTESMTHSTSSQKLKLAADSQTTWQSRDSSADGLLVYRAPGSDLAEPQLPSNIRILDDNTAQQRLQSAEITELDSLSLDKEYLSHDETCSFVMENKETRVTGPNINELSGGSSHQQIDKCLPSDLDRSSEATLAGNVWTGDVASSGKTVWPTDGLTTVNTLPCSSTTVVSTMACCESLKAIWDETPARSSCTQPPAAAAAADDDDDDADDDDAELAVASDEGLCRLHADQLWTCGDANLDMAFAFTHLVTGVLEALAAPTCALSECQSTRTAATTDEPQQQHHELQPALRGGGGYCVSLPTLWSQSLMSERSTGTMAAPWTSAAPADLTSPQTWPLTASSAASLDSSAAATASSLAPAAAALHSLKRYTGPTSYPAALNTWI